MRSWLALRAIFFLLLLPGMVAGYIPLRILQSTGQMRVPGLSLALMAAAVIAATGVAVLLKCIWDFFATGKGTLAPVDPPKQLVVGGLYRYTRNPMYNGVFAILIGEAWLFTSVWLIGYALAVLGIFHLFVVLYEEPALEKSFGASYRIYRHAVPRWGFTVHPFRENTASTH